MRTFIAIDFEEKTKRQIADFQDQIRADCKHGKFTYKDNIHLTLHFIGETDEYDLENLASAIEETAALNRKFTMNFTDLGYFDRGKECIMWLGTDKSKELVRLHQTLEKCLGKQGFKRERAQFSPHITIGREIVMIYNKKIAVEKFKPKIGEIIVKEISLLESKRVDGKLVYKKLYSAKLL